MQRPQIANEDGWVHVDSLAPGVILYHQIDEEEARYFGQAMPDDVDAVSVVDVKGGVRKTTGAVHTAHGLNRYKGENARVLIADTDQYHSVQDWHDVAEQLKTPWEPNVKVVSVDGPNFHFDILDAVRDYKPNYLVIDTPPNDEEASFRALLLSRIALMPTGPYPLDIRRLLFGIEVGLKVAEMRGAPIVPAALLTNCKLGTNLYTAARTQFDAWGLDYINMPVRDKVLHAESFGTNLPKLGDYEFIPKELVELFAKARLLTASALEGTH